MQKESVLPTNISQALLSFFSFSLSLSISWPRRRLRKSASDFVVDVGGALRRHLLDDVDRVAIVAAHLLIVRAVVVLCPQRNDDVAGLRASRAPRQLGVGQGAEGQRGGAGLRVGVFPGPLAHLNEEDNEEEDEQEEDDAADPDDGEQGRFGPEDALWIWRPGLVLIHVVWKTHIKREKGGLGTV